MFELLLILPFYWIFYCIVSRDRWTPLGFLRVWVILFFIAGLGRLGLYLVPRYAPILIISLLFVLIQLFGFKHTPKIKLEINSCLWILTAFFVFIRNVHPQFDVDSLSYHLPAMRWLFEKDHLQPVNAIIENQYFAYRLIGFEEYLLTPALYGNIAFYGGLIGGFLKILTLFSLRALIPTRWSFGRYLVAFLLLIDDHFFFSGQSRYVYLNPSIIALTALGYFFAWRSLRGSKQFIIATLISVLCLAGCKLHGALLAAGLMPLALCAYGKYLMKGNATNAQFKPPLMLWIVGPVLTLFSLYGLNWIETGSPVYPLSLGNISPRYFLHDLDYALKMVPTGSFGRALLNPIRTLVYPGNLAMKAAAVFFLPVFIVYLLKIWTPKNRFWKALGNNLGIKISKRCMGISFFSFFISILWACISEAITAGESRYPRFTFGLTTVGVVYLAYSIRLLKAVTWAKVAKNFSMCFGVAAFLYILTTVDSRYFNIPAKMRTSWPGIVRTLYSPSYRSLSPGNPLVVSLLDEFAKRNVPGLLSCFESLKLTSRAQESVVSGESILLYTAMSWPAYLVIPFAVRGDPLAAFRLPLGVNGLKDAGLRYVIFFKNWRDSIPGELKMLPLSYEAVKEAATREVACESDDMQIVAL